MEQIWTPGGTYRRVNYATENEFEAAVIELQEALFGTGCVYLDCKRHIGKRGYQINIPDGYLLDLSNSTPQLYVVENELQTHHVTKHIAVQILEFSLAFEADPRKVEQVLYEEITRDDAVLAQCQAYVDANNFRNLDNLLDALVHQSKFRALVIIDEIPPKLEHILNTKFQFPTEVLELAKYQDKRGETSYRFQAFQDGIQDDLKPTKPTTVRLKPDSIDTVVIAAREDGFEEVFLGENRWYPLKLHAAKRAQLKYIAAYQTHPVAAITHIAKVGSIEPWEDSGKFVINFDGAAEPVGPITLAGCPPGKAPQPIRYTSQERLLDAKTLNDVWA